MEEDEEEEWEETKEWGEVVGVCGVEAGGVGRSEVVVSCLDPVMCFVISIWPCQSLFFLRPCLWVYLMV